MVVVELVVALVEVSGGGGVIAQPSGRKYIPIFSSDMCNDELTSWVGIYPNGRFLCWYLSKWATLVHSGPFWAILAPLCHVRPFGPSWAAWITLEHSGPFGPFGPWGRLDHLRSFSPF